MMDVSVVFSIINHNIITLLQCYAYSDDFYFISILFGHIFLLPGSLTIPSSSNASHQLYDYMLKHDKMYNMKAVRMKPTVSAPDLDTVCINRPTVSTRDLDTVCINKPTVSAPDLDTICINKPTGTVSVPDLDTVHIHKPTASITNFDTICIHEAAPSPARTPDLDTVRIH